MRGIVVTRQRVLGWIRDDLDREYFFHRKVQKGIVVTFRGRRTPRGLRAEAVRIVDWRAIRPIAQS